ncbi:MAG TPA: GAF sensor protein [Elusimicrobia bacterium]|jgi:signal transduction protein with GAF and PtsI domain|nr:GAF sensor protein [Elusimicrobiota bacterium]
MKLKELKKELEEKKQQLEILQEVAGTISSSLELDEVLNHIVDIASSITWADSCLIYLYDPGKEELILRASKKPHPKILGRIKLKLGEGITGWVAKEKKPVVLSSGAGKDSRFKFFQNLPEDKFEAFLSVPIIAKKEIIGVINIQHKKEHSYPESQVNLLSTIGGYLGSAIENARIYEETKKKAKQLDVLSEISQTIVSNRYLKEILQLIVTMTAQVMNSKICSIMLLDEKKQELVIAASQSLSQEYLNKPNLKVGQSISGKVVKEKKPITVLDVTKETGYMYPEIAKKEGLVSMLSVPMMIKDRIIGVINSYTSDEHIFTEEEVEILQAIANQSAVAIESTNLTQQILEAKDALETRKLVERAKGILMKQLNLNEEEAHKRIHRTSMDLRKPMREVAEAIILTSEMGKKV